MALGSASVRGSLEGGVRCCPIIPGGVISSDAQRRTAIAAGPHTGPDKKLEHVGLLTGQAAQSCLDGTVSPPLGSPLDLFDMRTPIPVHEVGTCRLVAASTAERQGQEALGSSRSCDQRNDGTTGRRDDGPTGEALLRDDLRWRSAYPWPMESLTSWARATAEVYLRPLGRRWAHVAAVGKLAERIAPAFGADAETLVAAA